MMITTLEHARDALAAVPGVVSCKVGIEKNMSPADYPMIRVVPSRAIAGKPYSGRTIETMIYFGAKLDESEGLEDVYGALSVLEANIIDVLRSIQGRYIETITDEDRLDTYKLMMIRCELASPDTPHVRCVLYSLLVTEALTAVPAVIAPFGSTLQNSSASDWTPDLAAGTLTRLLNGASSTRTRVTVTGYVNGPAGEVVVGVYADGVQTGNRAAVVTAGVGVTVPFSLEITHTAAANVAFDIRATGNAPDNYTFSDLRMQAQRV